MRVLLVISNKQLAEKLAALNPDLEYCGIIIDEVEPAKKILEKVGLSDVPLYPMSELKTYADTLDYDYVVCLEDIWGLNSLMNTVEKCSVPRNKILNFSDLFKETNFLLERSLRYFKEHVAEFEMFATGISTVEKGIDPAQFKGKLFNFGRGSQDLYYNFQVAKSAISCGGGIVSSATH